MFEKFKSRLQAKRAFAAIDNDDIPGLIACLDAGFDVNTKRFATMWELGGKADTMGFEETVGSRALRDNKWDMLKILIERCGAENLIMADFVSPSPPAIMRLSVLRSGDSPAWDNLAEMTQDSSAHHFCLWHLGRPDSKVGSIPAQILEDYWAPSGQRENDLNAFFKNCEVLEQGNTLNKALGDTKEHKGPRAPRAF